MNPTGVCPREKSAWRLTAPKRCLAPLGVFGMALSGMLLNANPAASAAEYDPNLPRVEEVLDTDGSVWKVLIVPRPLYRPGVPQPHCYVPPLHESADKAVVPAPAPSEKADPAKSAKPIKPSKPTKPAKNQPKASPAEAEKTTDDQAALLGQTEAVSTQETEPKPEDAPANYEEKKPAKDIEPKASEPAVEPPFGVEIVPRFSYPMLSPSEACCTPHDQSVHVNPANYALVYHSLPFLRSEYVANPSYRHEATMEILFGQLRPTVVHKHPGEPRPHETQFPYENDLIRPYSYYSLGAGLGYGRGPLPFAAPGAYGMNYNFYYPMPTVYRNY